MFLPFALPHASLQNLRRRMFYWRVVYNYRLLTQSKALTEDKATYKLLRFVGAVLLVKSIEKGARSLKEEQLHDYSARKANIDAAEKALWNEELALHSVDTAVAETVVYRQRQVDHKYRSNPSGHATAMQDMMFPVLVKEMK